MTLIRGIAAHHRENCLNCVFSLIGRFYSACNQAIICFAVLLLGWPGATVCVVVGLQYGLVNGKQVLCVSSGCNNSHQVTVMMQKTTSCYI